MTEATYHIISEFYIYNETNYDVYIHTSTKSFTKIVNDFEKKNPMFIPNGQVVITAITNDLQAYTNDCNRKQSLIFTQTFIKKPSVETFLEIFKEEIQYIPGFGEAFQQAKERFERGISTRQAKERFESFERGISTSKGTF